MLKYTFSSYCIGICSSHFQIGTWSEKDALVVTKRFTQVDAKLVPTDAPLIVSTILVSGRYLLQISFESLPTSPNAYVILINTVFLKQEEPYMILKQNHEQLEGNDRYEGYCVDLLKKLEQKANITWVIKLVNDSKYGVVSRHYSGQQLKSIFGGQVNSHVKHRS